MKLALFFLSCFFALSQQQNAFWPQYPGPTQQSAYFPFRGYHNLNQWSNIYSGASINPYYSLFQNPYFFNQQYQPFYSRQQKPNMVFVKSFDSPANEEVFDINQDDSVFDIDNQDIEPRLGGFSSAKELIPESRNALLISALLGAYSTSTKYTFVTTTITSTSIQSCLLSGSFSPGSTTACRRRREVMLMDELLGESNVVSPSQVQSVEASSVLSHDSLGHSVPERPGREAVDIVSSMDEEGKDQDMFILSEDQINRANRAFGLYTGLFISKTTSTITTATVSITVTKKTITLNAGASLLCLPAGFSIC